MGQPPPGEGRRGEEAEIHPKDDTIRHAFNYLYCGYLTHKIVFFVQCSSVASLEKKKNPLFSALGAVHTVGSSRYLVIIATGGFR